jgi:hypothetical protein
MMMTMMTLKVALNNRQKIKTFLIPFICISSSSRSLFTIRDLAITPQSKTFKATLASYLGSFRMNIMWAMVTSDSVSGNFPYQQTNQDFWVMLQGNSGQVEKGLLLGLLNDRDIDCYKCVPHDEKSGMDMFKRSTRGTLGYLTYEGDYIVPFTGAQINLCAYNVDRVRSILQALKNDNQDFYYEKDLNQYLDKFKKLNPTQSKQIRCLHNELQDYLWTNIQLDPMFKRSISFIFLHEVTYEPFSEKMTHFEDRFCFYLKHDRTTFSEDELFNLDKIGDRRLVFNAMLKAYQETIDPDICTKIKHLQHKGDLKFDVHFSNEIASVMKYAIQC